MEESRLYLAGMSVATVVATEDGVLTVFNPAASKLFGYTEVCVSCVSSVYTTQHRQGSGSERSTLDDSLVYDRNKLWAKILRFCAIPPTPSSTTSTSRATRTLVPTVEEEEGE